VLVGTATLVVNRAQMLSLVSFFNVLFLLVHLQLQ
jgi:hypothetical protein